MFGLWLQCPLPVPAVRFPSGSGTAGAGGEQPLPAAVSCRPLRCHILGCSCHQHPVWPHCASTRGRGKPHPPVGFCQSKISPVGDLGTGWYSHSKWGFIPWRLFQLPGGVSSALPLCSDSVDAGPKKGPCPMQCFAGRCPEKELLALGKLLVSAGGCSRAVCPPQWVGGCQCLSAGTCPLQVCLVTFSHMYCCCLEVLFPWSPTEWGGEAGQE